MRLIDADELKEEIRKIVKEECPIHETWAAGLRYSLKIIDNAQAVERPKGKWINQFIGGNECVMCSECKLHFDIGTNFCPNCGADMRGAE